MPINEEMGIEEFVKRIKDSIDKNPTNRYLFFIGAGCSIPSKIPGASKLTKQWLEELKYFLQPDEYSKWYEDNIGSKNNSNMAKFYSIVIKKRFPIKSDRQQEMERLIDNGKESFGYVVLVHLLTSKKYGKNFNIVFTTNFDNLIAESIYRYTSEKARIISHDSLMSFVNIQSHKPQIVKLHGDVEFDPKNTEEETIKLNDDALETVKHTLTNCGLIFIGYGGNDKSIINSLVQISEKSITNGIFWVRNSLPDSKLKDWLDSREHSFWIKYSNFDQMMMYFLKYFDIPRPDKKRCLEAESDFQKSLENFSKQIKNFDAPKKKQFRKILKKYVSSVDDWVSIAIEANEFSKTDFKKAVGMYEAGIKKFPNNVNLLNSFGTLYIINKKYGDAIKYYDKSLEIEPDNATTLSNKGAALNYLDKHEDAIKCHDKSLEIEPDNATTLSNKGAALTSVNKHEEAIKYYNKSLEIEPDSAITLSNIGGALDKMGKHEEAIKYHDKSLEIEPDNATTLSNKGLALDNMGKHEEAIKFYDKSLEVEPYDAITLGSKGTALNQMGKSEDAIKCHDKSLEIRPDSATVLNNKGIALDNMGKYEDAIKSYNKSLEIRPDHANTLNNKGLSLEDMGKSEEAKQTFQKIMKIVSTDMDISYFKGVALDYLGNSEESLKYFNEHLAKNINDKFSLHRKGLALMHLKKYGEAIKCFDHALKIDPKFERVIYRMASLQSILNNKKESLKLLAQAINLNHWNKTTINLKDFENIKDDSEFKKLIS